MMSKRGNRISTGDMHGDVLMPIPASLELQLRYGVVLLLSVLVILPTTFLHEA